MTKPTTGKYSFKLYQCQTCGHKHNIGTNHWGETYGRCSNCAWENPMTGGGPFTCLEPCPSTHDLPPKWKRVKLSDIATITKGKG